MEMKVDIKIAEALKISEALRQLLSLPGIGHKTVYWIDRNRKSLETPLKQWQGAAMEIVKRYNQPIPATAFVPPLKFSHFRTELIKAFNSGLLVTEEDLVAVFEHFEAVSNLGGMEGIPPESQKAYQKEVEELEAATMVHYEYTPLIVSGALEQALTNLVGELVVSLSFMLEEPSKLEVFQNGLEIIQ